MYNIINFNLLHKKYEPFGFECFQGDWILVYKYNVNYLITNAVSN